MIQLVQLLIIGFIVDSSLAALRHPLYKYPHLRDGKSCSFEGEMFESGTTIPRRNPCHSCICVRGRIECFWQRCPPPPEGCQEMTFKDICNPSIYNCPIPDVNSTMAEMVINYRQKYGSRSLKMTPVKADCVIKGIAYFTGEIIGQATNNCLQCRCARNSMYCTPLCCYQPAIPGEDEAEKQFRTNLLDRRPEANPLAHIFGQSSLDQSGTI